MGSREETRANRRVMILPVLLLSIIISIILMEGFFLMLLPLLVFLCVAAALAKRLSREDAGAFPLVLCPFLLLAIFLSFVPGFGFGFYLFAPMAFAINMTIGTIYFRFARKKMDHAKFLVCLVTLAVTVILFFLMRA